ncbi:hypothetical protein Enr13x_03630 [Stieleria neptunia]|uniref:Uncharacterized protein n=1 Tax=Stieleria neptunia TaxID=2527979 RepID=A0A518HI89_9BACT|nr:hypothetical protein Enr13x_03630 [Stieleria neptunia]
MESGGAGAETAEKRVSADFDRFKFNLSEPAMPSLPPPGGTRHGLSIE